ncbi:calpain-D-like [Saccostrea echinata]|uniref:calpain-D-like n=1 Tax=Saccostrea echinata TaxID=191078 RepID=UPI002A82E9C0|nr:calpain-D-like [Saccostrea echinata]
MFKKFFNKKDLPSSSWECYKCNKKIEPGEKCDNCDRKFNKEKDKELDNSSEKVTHKEDPEFKINKYDKKKEKENVGTGIKTITNKQPNSAQAADKESVQTSSLSTDHVNGANYDAQGHGDDKQKLSDGWTCKICHKSGNLDLDCKMCQERKKESIDEGDIKNRKKRKQLNRSRLKAGRSIRVDKERDRQKKIAQQIATNIKEYCKKNSTCYKDESFPDPNAPNRDGEQWKRIDYIKDKCCKGKEPWTVFRNPSPDDAIQGSAENCWFLCSVSLLAQREDLLREILITENYCPEGLYQVRLCKDGNWKTVIVDDRFPCDEHGNLKYARPHNRQLWVMLLEKAAAKLHGGYKALDSGLVVESLAMLTGEPCKHIDLGGVDIQKKDDKKLKIDRDKLWEDLKNWRSLGYLLGVSTSPDLTHDELFRAHCYPILDIEETADGKRLMKLWTSTDHQHCITGCLKRSSLQKDKKKLLRHLKKGQFWILFEEEFMEHFNYLSVCKTDSGWFESRFKGVFLPELSNDWKYYSFRLTMDTKLKLSLFQKSMRGAGLMVEQFVDLLIMVLQNQVDGSGLPFKQAPLFSRVMDYSERRARSLTTCEVDLAPGSYTVACFSFGKLRRGGDEYTDEDYVNYTLSIHSSVQLLFMDECEVNPKSFPELRYAPADALITLAKQCKVEERFDTEKLQSDVRLSTVDDGIYCVMFMFYGEICVFINETSGGYAYVRNYGQSSYLMSLRHKMKTADFIPAKSGHVINIVTPMDPMTDWVVAAQKNGRPVTEEFSSDPAIPQTLEGLLKARPIPEITKH